MPNHTTVFSLNEPRSSEAPGPPPSWRLRIAMNEDAQPLVQGRQQQQQIAVIAHAQRLLANQSVQEERIKPVSVIEQCPEDLPGTDSGGGLLPAPDQRKLKPVFLLVQDNRLGKVLHRKPSENKFGLRGGDGPFESLRPAPADFPGVLESAEVSKKGRGEVGFMYHQVVR